MRFIPALNRRFLDYGPRTTSAPTQSSGRLENKPGARRADPGTWLLDAVASCTVPHQYFFHYYLLALVTTAFWMSQVLTQGPAIQFIATYVSDAHLQQSMTLHQVVLCTSLMMVQAGRRLYECIAFTKPSSSQMSIAHWLLGLAFYAGITTSVWIEGTGTLSILSFCESKRYSFHWLNGCSRCYPPNIVYHK